MTQMRLLILLAVMTLSYSSYGQNNTVFKKANKKIIQKDKLAGTWRLIEFADVDSVSGNWEYRYGKNPKGYFTYTENGIVNLNISSGTPLKISEASAENYSIKLLDWTNNYSVGYFGTYSVDFKNSIVTHHVTGGSIPWYIDTDQERPFILKGDTLIIGDNKTWKRVLVKED